MGENASSFTTGGGAGLAVDFGLTPLPFLFIRTVLDYEYIPIETKDALSVFSVSANVIIKYTQKGREYARKYVASMDMYDRNAITWDDDRKAAAFVTAKGPAVLEYAKNISGWIKQIRPTTIDKNLCIAMGMHNSLTEYGITYQIDPRTPFTEFSKDTLSVDFLQFPRQTLTYTSGDCDDLSILYSALLDSESSVV